MRLQKDAYNNVARNGRARVACLLATASLIALAMAPRASVAQSPTAAAQQSFSISSGPLSQALAAFGRQTGLQVTYLPETAGDRQSPGVSGTLSPRQALARLLSGTNLAYHFSNAATVVIEREPSGGGAAINVSGAVTLETIDVNGHGETAWGVVQGYVATRSATGSKTDSPLIETPAAISVITRDQIQAQAAQSIPQAVRYTSGVRTDVAGADTRFDYVYVRGFLADLYLDGMKLFTNGFSTSIIEPYNLERIEVLHGPASVLYGQASPGGLVDMVSKRPTEDPYHEVFISTGSYGRIQGGVDLSGPIDQNRQWLYRLTASGFDVGSQVNFTRYDRVSIAPALTWRPDGDTSVTLLGTYQDDPKAGFYNQLPSKGYGTLFPLANGQFIPTSFYPGAPNQDRMSRELAQVGYLAEHRFNNVWMVRQNLRYSDVNSKITTIYPTGASTIDPYGLTRAGFFENDRLNTFDLDSQVEAKFGLGPIANTALFGIDYQTGSYGYTAGGPPTDFTVPTISVAAPNYSQFIPMTATSQNSQKFNQVGLYGQDEIKLDHWVALLGLRWDHADSNTQTITLANGTTTTTQLSNDALTKRGALLYKFDNGVAPYIQYTESFQPQTGTAFGGGPFVPTKGQQEEAGIKYQPNDKSLFSVAAFNLVQDNVLASDLSHPGFSVQTGQIRSRGIETEAKTEIDRSLSLLASYTYLDQAITKSNVAYQTGRRPVGMPTHSASVWTDYTFRSGPFDGFGLSGGIRFIGDTAGNISGTSVLNVPAVTLFDAAVHYDFAGISQQLKGLSLQVNATNLFDKTYVGLCQDAGCYYGLRRQVIATLRYRW